MRAVVNANTAPLAVTIQMTGVDNQFSPIGANTVVRVTSTGTAYVTKTDGPATASDFAIAGGAGPPIVAASPVSDTVCDVVIAAGALAGTLTLTDKTSNTTLSLFAVGTSPAVAPTADGNSPYDHRRHVCIVGRE